MESWRRVFKQGKHPDRRKSRRSHADGRLSIDQSVPFVKLRDAFLRSKRSRRISAKSKPWVGALFGVAGHIVVPNRPDGTADCPDDDFLEYEEFFIGDFDDDGTGYEDPWEQPIDLDGNPLGFVPQGAYCSFCSHRASWRYELCLRER